MAEELRRRKPWTWGPLELIRHADGHFRSGGDTDRRIALIGFDNTVEVCIDVFLNLNPRLRNGYEISGQEKQGFLRNYHTKIEFLDKFLLEQGRTRCPLDTPVEAIVWYHSLRNQLYHSGNGMVPEIHVVEGARRAALDVFKLLFEEDISALVSSDVGQETPPDTRPAAALEENPSANRAPPPAIFVTHDDRMELLRVYIEFEGVLRNALAEAGTAEPRPQNATSMWRLYRRQHEVDPAWDNVVNAATKARNEIAHAGSTSMGEDEVIELAVGLMDLSDLLRRDHNLGGSQRLVSEAGR